MIVPGDKSLLLTLFEAAQVDRDELTRFQLRAARNDLDAAIIGLGKTFTPDAMIAVNGAWAHAMRVLDRARGPAGGPVSGGGLKDGAMLAA